MAENKFPEKLLIYAPINKYCVDVILKNRLVFTNPIKGFNDPLDCYFEIRFDNMTREELIEQLSGDFISKKEKVLDELTVKDHDEISREKMRLAGLDKSILMEELSNNATELIRKKISDDVRIRCFSALNVKNTLNNVLFSHYGDSHKGLCYIFNTDKIDPKRESLFEVKYSYKPASFEFKEDIASYSEKDLAKIGVGMTSVKHRAWKYEDEYRVLTGAKSPDQIHEAEEFPQDALEEIVLGLNTTKNDEERIIALAQKRAVKINIFRASRIFKSFDLQYKDNQIF